MKNSDRWKPSKFVFIKGKLRASRNENEVTISSRFVADLVAAHYDQYLRGHVTGRLVDLGCGKVPLYHAYQKLASQCICADWQSTIHKNPFLDITCDLNKQLPFNTNEFNTIILSDVMEHIAKPESLWLEMSRILQPKGKIILNVPFFYKLHEIPHDYFRYTRYALENFANTTGFKIVLLQELGGLPEILTDLTAKYVFHLPVVGRFFSILIQHLGSLFIHTGIGKKISQKTKEHFPLGYFMIVEKVS
jgi:2-polyprenyl-3-methyl-5-hydroxy-6-metoxy-1,4-benzoquinol methylase